MPNVNTLQLIEMLVEENTPNILNVKQKLDEKDFCGAVDSALKISNTFLRDSLLQSIISSSTDFTLSERTIEHLSEKNQLSTYTELLEKCRLLDGNEEIANRIEKKVIMLKGAEITK